MIRDDRELLAELARLNTDMVPLAMRVMDGSAHAAEQVQFGQRLIAAGERLQRRANETIGTVIEGEVLASESLTLASESLTLPAHTAEPHWESPVARKTTIDTAPAGRRGRPGHHTPLSGDE